MSPVTICPVAWGPDGERMLADWRAIYETSGNGMPVIPITASHAPVADPTAIQLELPPSVRDGRPLAIAGWLKMHAIRAVAPPVIAVDCDLLITGDIGGIIIDAADAAIAMCPDIGTRSYPWWPEVGEELNSGLIWCTDPAVPLQYDRAWSECPDPRALIKFMWADEIVSTVVLRQHSRGRILPARYNCSHHIAAAHDYLPTVHFHGPDKKPLAQLVRRLLDERAQI